MYINGYTVTIYIYFECDWTNTQRDAPWQQQCTNDDVLNINCWLSHSMNPTTVANFKFFYFYILYTIHIVSTQLREYVGWLCFFFVFASLLLIQYICICKLVRMWKTKMLSNQSGLHIYYNLAKIIMRFSINTKYYIMGAAMLLSCI